ncbi:hypothetical protein BC332_01858 [Capsicum chinense]|nr:hypothetical protein BC332_01858 [Capsicum chinense]
MSPVIIQATVTDASSMKEQLVNLTKAIEGLTKYVQNQNAWIDKLVDRMDGLIYQESSHVHGKAPKVYEIDHPAKQTPLAKELPKVTPRMLSTSVENLESIALFNELDLDLYLNSRAFKLVLEYYGLDLEYLNLQRNLRRLIHEVSLAFC